MITYIWKRKFQGANVPGRKFPRTFAATSENSRSKSSRELKLHGVKVPGSESSRARVPGSYWNWPGGEKAVIREIHKMKIKLMVSYELEVTRRSVFTPAMCFVRRYAEVGMSDNVAHVFAPVAHGLCNLNSAINPVIYYLMSGMLRISHIQYSLDIQCGQKKVLRVCCPSVFEDIRRREISSSKYATY